MEKKPNINFYHNSNGGVDLYDVSDFKFTEAIIDEDARLISFKFLENNKEKWCDISFSVLQELITGGRK